MTAKRNSKGKITSDAVDVFCPVTGPNFTLEINETGEQNSYKKSAFDDKPTVLAETDKEFTKIMSECHNLDKIYLDESTFLTEEDIQKRFNRFVGVETVSTRSNEVPVETSEVDGEDGYEYSDDAVKSDSDDIDDIPSF